MQLSGPITIDTPLGPDVLIFRSMVTRETMGQVFLFDVDVLSTRNDVKPKELLGQTVTVHLETANFGSRHYNGHVTRLEYRGSSDNYSAYRLTLRPWLWFLSQSVNSRIFQKKSIPDIIKLIFREYREPPRGKDGGNKDASPPSGAQTKPARGIGLLTHFSESLSENHVPLEYVVQYRETDFQFVSRLMERAGIYFFFRHHADKHELVLADSYGAHEKAPGYESLPYLPPDDHRHSSIEYIDDWRLIEQAGPGIYTHWDFDFTQASKPIQAAAPAPKEHAGAAVEIYEYPGRFVDNTEGEGIAKLRLQEWQAPYEVVLGSSIARGLTLGNLFSLTDHPRGDQNKEYLVVAQECELHGHELMSGDSDELTFRCSFEARDSTVPFRLPATTEKPVMRGPQTAIVVGKNTEEIWTDEFGRVMVQFHWDREGEYDENSSCFIRVAQLWAGSGWGGMHIPRIGQEVIVDFLEGDPDQPIIVGRVYNNDNPVPYKTPDGKSASGTASGIKSHSTKDGTADNFNEIKFEDKKGAEVFSMQAEKDQTILVKHNLSTTVKANRSANVTAADSVTVGADRSVNVTGNLSVVVKGGGKSANHHDIEVTGKSHLHATDTIEMEAPTHIKFTVGNTYILIEPTQITLEAEGKGKIVIDAHILAQSSDVTKIVLDANALVQASTGAEMVLDATAAVKSKDVKAMMLLDNDATILAKGDAKLGATNVTINGTTQVTATGGDTSSLNLAKPSADLGGTMVNVNGDSMVSIAGSMIKIG